MKVRLNGISGDGRIAPVAVANHKAGALKLVPVLCFILMLMGTLMLGGSEPVLAASCKLTFSCKSDTVRIEDVFIVELELEGEVIPGIFEGYITYTPDVAEFVAGPECAAGGEGTLRISDINYEATTTSRKYVLYFKAVKMGTCEISMRGTPEIYEADMGNLMSVSSNKLSFEVKPSDKASSDATLAALKVNPGTLTPEFSPETHEYSTSVDYETKAIFVSASPNHVDASVRIEGNQELEVGQNRILVFVTAEDGTVEKYVIYAVRASLDGADQADTQAGADGELPEVTAAEGETTGETNEQAASLGTDRKSPEGWAFYAGDEGEGVFLVVDSKYKVCGEDSGVEVPEGYNKSSVLVSGRNVTAYYPSGNKDSNFLLMVLQKGDEAPALYTFDRIEKTLQRVDREDLIGGNMTASGYSTLDEEELVKSYQKSLGTMTMVIAVLSGVCMLLLIITIRLAVRSRQDLD
ncbi:MAG: cadherin-like beta sandwich domain-containing protein [Lachnospiraceae bacterium]|nr:cadherin-like beta sandwich domain-containing protein [Lachnospiraceae bacterium]